MKATNIFPVILILFVVGAVPTSQVFAETPFSVSIIEKPKTLQAGHEYKFVFEVRNITDAPLTLNSTCAASVSLSWVNRDGTGEGTGSGCGSSSMETLTDFDPVAGKFTCVTTILPYPYDRDDFYTLQPNESKLFEANTKAPNGIKRKFIDAIVTYQSRYDGNEIGLHAWTGPATSINLKMRVTK